MKYILILSTFLLSSCASMCPGVLCASGGSSSQYVEPAKPVPAPVVEPKPTAPASGFPVFKMEWKLKKSLYDKMVQYHSTYGKPMRYVAIADMSQHSSQKRLYIFDLQNGSVEQHNVAHGSGSDKDNNGYLEAFSNVPGSNASSEGMYKTAETYNGKHGLSLRLDGLEATNSNARARAVVMHAADYVKDGAHTGRSWGCPALDGAVYKSIIDRLKGGSLLLIGK